MFRTVSTLLLMTTLLGACASDPMSSYYACRKHGVGMETCGQMSFGGLYGRVGTPLTR